MFHDKPPIEGAAFSRAPLMARLVRLLKSSKRNSRVARQDERGLASSQTASAASSLLSPFAISGQNSRSTSRRNDGLPGDFIGALPVSSVIHPAGLPIAHLRAQALRGPVEST